MMYEPVTIRDFETTSHETLWDRITDRYCDLNTNLNDTVALPGKHGKANRDNGK